MHFRCQTATATEWTFDCLMRRMHCSESSDSIGTEATPLTANDFACAYQVGLRNTSRYLRAVGANSATAEEIAQAAWARGWQYRQQVANPLAIVAWVNTIARNLYWLSLAQQKRLAEVVDRQVDSCLLRSIEVKQIFRLCSPLETKLLRLFYLEGYSTLEIAHSEGMSASTVRVRLMRLRGSLRVRMGGEHQIPKPKPLRQPRMAAGWSLTCTVVEPGV